MINKSLVTALSKVNKREDKGLVFINSSSEEVFLSYKDLYQEASCILGNLQRSGLDAGHELIFQIEDNKSFLLIFWACLLGKIIPVPIALGSKDDSRLKVFSVWETLNAPRLISDIINLERLMTFADKNELGVSAAQMRTGFLDLQKILIPGAAGELVEIEEEDIAYIQYSSGSTGTPKGVILTHANLWYNTIDIIERSEITAEDSTLSWMPLTHDMGMICFHLSSLHAGVNQYIIPTPLFIRRPLLWLDKASEHQIGILYSPNFGYQYLLSAFKPQLALDWDLSKVRLIYNGAEIISHELCAQFLSALEPYKMASDVIFPGYGLAEASVAVTLPQPKNPVEIYPVHRNHLNVGDKVLFIDQKEKDCIVFVGLGTPIRHCSIRVCNASGEVLSEGYTGHIQISGKNVTKGYYNNIKAGEDIFTADHWLKTGDLGFVSNGQLIIIGRFKNVIIINGQNFYPHDIEKYAQDANLADIGKIVAVSVRKEKSLAEELILFVLYKGALEGFMPLAAQLKTEILSGLGLSVDQVLPVRTIPKTSSGKIQNFKLIEEFQGGKFDVVIQQIEKLSAAALNVQGTTAEILQKLAAQVTGVTLAADDDFFLAGFNSLHITGFVSLVNKILALNLTLAEVFNYPSILKLAAYLSEREGKEHKGIVRAEKKEYYELVERQKKFWFIEKYIQESSAFNISLRYTLNGVVRPDIFERAIQTIVERHEALRTIFTEIDGEPKQQIIEAYQAVPDFSFIDLKEADDKHEQLEQLIDLEAGRLFNLYTGPLLRVRLIQLESDVFTFQLTIHHIIADGWSVTIILKELSALYSAYAQGKENPLPALNYQAKDFIDWVKARHSTAELDRFRQYWLQELNGDLPLLNLPVYQAAADSEKKQASSLSFTFPAAVYEQLTVLGRQYKSSTFVSLISMLNVLFYKYSGQEDILLGSVIADRATEELKDQIGYYLNTVILKNKVQDDTSFSELLTSVRAGVFDAVANQYYSLEELVKETSSDSGRIQGFNVLVILQNFESYFHNLDGSVTCTSEHITATHGITDLQLEFVEIEGSLGLDIRYNTDLFKESQIRLLVSHFEKLVQEASNNPEGKISAINLLTAEEKNIILTAYNSDQKNDIIPDQTVIDLFENNVLLNPDSIAIECGEVSLTYQELNSQANQLADLLLNKYKVNAGDVVGLYLERSEYYIIALLGVLKTGAAFLPVDIEYPQERVAGMIADSEARLLISYKESALADIQLEKLFIGDIKAQLAIGSALNPHPVRRQNDLAYILYTSGSTGTPKGVLIEQLSLLDYVLTFSDYFKISSHDRVVQQSSFTFDTSIEEIFPALCNAATLVILQDGARDIEELLKTVEQRKITVLSTTPLVLNEINHRLGENNSLRLIISGGDKLKASYIDRLIGKFDLYDSYGPTESTVCTTYNKINSLADISNIGKAIPGRSVFIVNERVELLPAGTIGELAIGGRGLARGYKNNPELTASKFIANPFVAGERLYLTGDMGRFMPDGSIIFIGRRDEQLKIRGQRVELGEIENVLSRYPGVSNVKVLAMENEQSMLSLVAYIDAEDQGISRIRSFAERYLPQYMIPAAWCFVTPFPLLENGKIDHRSLLLSERVTGDDNELILPVTEVEVKLMEIWEEVLGTTVGGTNVSFFHIGGHSLLAAKILSRIYECYGIKIGIKYIFTCPTISELARKIEESERQTYERIIAVADKEYHEVSHGQKRLWILDKIIKTPSLYNIYCAFELDGKLDNDAFTKAFNYLIAKYESLRTVFIEVDGEPKQVILKPGATDFNVSYLTVADDLDFNQEAAYHLNLDLNTSFNLEKGPLLSAKVLSGEEKTFFVLAFHHIITDGWSLEIFARELITLYEAYVVKEVAPVLTFPGIQFKDFVYWQNSLLHTAEGRQHQLYWLDKFKDGVPVLDFPADFTRPAVRSYRGETLSMILEKDVSAGLRSLSEENNASLFMVLTASLSVLLFRYTNQGDLVIGVPVAGRDHKELEDQIGFFVNTLSLRLKFDAQHTFQELLDLVKNEVLDSYRHQEYPFDMLIDDLAIARDFNRTPLFDIMIVLENERKESNNMVINGKKLQKYDFANHLSKFDLTFIFTETENGIELILEYNTDIFSKARMERLMVHLNVILKNVTLKSDTPICYLEFLPAEEKNQLVNLFNATDAPYSSDLTIHEMIDRQVMKSPDAIAIRTENGSMTYSALHNRANRLANFLIHHGCVQGTHIGVLMNRSEEMIVAVLAVLKAGGNYVPMEPYLPKKRIKGILERLEISILITDHSQVYAAQHLLWELTRLKNLICLDLSSGVLPVEVFNEEVSVQFWDHLSDSGTDYIAQGGFYSSYTGHCFEEKEVHQYVNHITDLFRSRLHAQANVLEIGCGSGAIMFEIAALTSHYYGLDPSSATQKRNEKRIAEEGISNITLLEMFAHGIDTLSPDSFDLIIIPSTVQFFPGHRYLEMVIDKAIKLLKPGGALFIADIPDLDKKEAFGESLRVFKEANSTSDYKTKENLDGEFYLGSEFFKWYCAKNKLIECKVFDRSGVFKNELQYRFDVRIEKQYGAYTGDTPIIKNIYTDFHVSAYPANRPEVMVMPDDLAYIIFTSGTTGVPKGVYVKHRPVINLIEWVNKSFRINADDRVLFITSLSFDLSVYDIFGILSAGASIYVANNEDIRDPEKLLSLLSDEKITFWDSAPAALQQLVPFMSMNEIKNSTSLRLVFLSGDWIPLDLPVAVREKFPLASIVSLGGATEATVWSNYFPVEAIDPAWLSIPYGKPIQNARYYILDAFLQVCPAGVPGDLYIGGLCLAEGYIGDEELTAQKFIKNPFIAASEARIYRTGDMAKWFDDGNIEFLGRKDSQVKIRGYRIELGEVESILSTHPAVRNVLVVTDTDDAGSKNLIAYYIEKDTLDPYKLRKYASEFLPAYMIPAYFVSIPAFPVSFNGKIDYKALPKPGADIQYDHSSYLAPENSLQELILKVWLEVLNRGVIGVTDNFFEVGGDSIKAIQIASRLYKEGYKLEVRHIFQHPEIRFLADYVQPVTRIADQGAVFGAVALSPVQSWFFNAEHPFPHHFNQSVLLRPVERIDFTALTLVAAELQGHHDGLRMHYLMEGDTVKQVNGLLTEGGGLSCYDLSGEKEWERIMGEKSQELQQGIDLASGPLLKMCLFKLDDSDRLLIVVHHLVIDGISWRILLEDLGELLAQHREGKVFTLPLKTDSYRSWTSGLQDYYQQAFASQVDYWENLGRVSAGLSVWSKGNEVRYIEDLSVVEMTLAAAETELLLTSVNSAYHTEINDVLLTALLLAVNEVFGLDKVLLALEGHGREEVLKDIEVSRTIGWFTSIYPVLLEVYPGADLPRQLKEVKEQLRQIPDKGIGYGVLKYLGPSLFSAEIRPEISFNYLGQFDADLATTGFSLAAEFAGAERSAKTKTDYVLDVSGMVINGELMMTINYSPVFTSAQADKLINSYHSILSELINHCSNTETKELTPSDFDYKNLSVTDLDTLFS